MFHGFCSKKEAHIVTCGKDGIYLNGIKIIDNRAELQVAFLKVLIRHCYNEIITGPYYLSTQKICSELNKQFPNNSNDPNQIYYIVRNIKRTVRKQMHIQSAIIDSENWNGYRLAKDVFCVRSDAHVKSFSSHIMTLKKHH